MKALFFILCTLAYCTSLPHHLHAEEMLITMPPAFVPARDSDGAPQYLTEAEVEHFFRKYSKNLKKVVYNHNIKNFIVPDANWLHSLIDVYEDFLYHHQIRPQRDTWDCENYSILLNSFASIRLWRAGYSNTRLAIGWIRVNARYAWADIPDAVHALIFAVTSDGVYVIEPQNGHFALLQDYPNREFIEEVYLF